MTLRQRDAPRPLEGLNPALIVPEYTDPFVREGVLSLNVTAVSQYGRALAPVALADGPHWYRTARGTEWYRELAKSAESLRTQVRAWVGRQGIDQALGRCLDAFIHRVDKEVLVQLADTLNDAGLDDAEQRPIWEAVARRSTLADLRRFVERPLGAVVADARGETAEH